MLKIKELEKVLENQLGYRWKQIQKWLFSGLIDDWDQATDLSIGLRKELTIACPLGIAGDVLIAGDKESIKAALILEDGLKVETVLMRHKDGRNTVCVSSQVGCPLNCSFCATGAMGFERNLSRDEIISQVIFFARYLKKLDCSRITNIVLMGMGEPFLNYENVIGAIRFLNDPNGFGLGARRFSISTAGLPGGIRKLADEKLEINLAISLHAPDDELRSTIMPINRQYCIAELMLAVDEYIKKTHRRVMLEYLLIDGVNDSEENARELVVITKKPLRFVNLILYNQTGKFRPSPARAVREFKEILEKEGVAVTLRYRFGQGIEAACGQLALKKQYKDNQGN